MEDPAETAEVSFDNDKPLGVSAQDPLLAQHVPCIESMSIGPTTRPCIGTDLVTQAQPVAILPLVERMSAQAGCKEKMEIPQKDCSKRHECLSHLGEG